MFDETKFFELADIQQQSQEKVTEVIKFNEIEIQLYVRMISEEEKQWLTTPLYARTALDTITSLATESPHDTPTSLVMELQKIAQKSLEQYQTQ